MNEAEWLGCIKKFNPNHDELGRFTTSNSAVKDSFSAQEKQWIAEHKAAQAKAEEEGTVASGVRHDAVLTGEGTSPEAALAVLRGTSLWEGTPALDRAKMNFVLKEGGLMPVPKEPPPLQLMEMKQCFKNATDMVLGQRVRDLEYVEGYVIIPLRGGGWHPVHHAWVFDKSTNILLDPTLGWSPKAQYVGVRFGKYELMRQLATNKYYGLLEQNYKPSKLLAGKDKKFPYKEVT